MNPERKRKKRAAYQISSRAEYERFKDSVVLTDEQRKIMDMVFINGHTYAYIGDALGYSERTIKHKMLKILDKL